MNNNYLKTLSDEELNNLKEAMLTARKSYRAAMEIIGRGNRTNPGDVMKQQAMLEDILREFAQGAGLGYIGDVQQIGSDWLREYLKPLGFSDDELPDYSLPDIK